MPREGANSVNQELNLLVVIKHLPAHHQQKVSLTRCKMGTQCTSHTSYREAKTGVIRKDTVQI